MYIKVLNNRVAARVFIFISILKLGSSYAVGDGFLTPLIEDQEDYFMEQQQYPMLSSYELFSITDLLMEISLRPCPLVSRPLMGSIKQFLVAGLSHAPQQSDSHHAFYTTYHNLVNCLSRTDETYSKVKNLESPFMLSNKGKKMRTRREAPKEDKDGVRTTPKSNHLANHHEFLEELSIIDPELSFEEFFNLLFSITDQTCNKEMGTQLPIEFMVPLLSEVTYWAKAQGSSVYKTAQVKYFHNNNVLDELRKCEKTFLGPPEVTTVPPYAKL